MRRKSIFYSLSLSVLLLSCKEMKKADSAETLSPEETVQTPAVGFREDVANQKVDVTINGQPFTSYVFDGKTPKPILYPILTKGGKIVTRGFPYNPRPNERVDHPHHVGLWFNYGDVNGLDFWNNSYAIPEGEKDKYGTIYHQEIVENNESDGTLTTRALWRSPDQTDLLEEVAQFRFGEEGNTRFIDRTATLKALVDVRLTDNKEGMLGLRVARELEIPTDKPGIFTDAQGNVTTVESLNNDGVTGDYLGSEGLMGDAVWATRNDWVRLQGIIQGDTVSVTILDHKKNIGYPTYWHARGYGLFAANPLGQAIFSNGKETLDFQLKKGETATFAYRILIHEGSELTKSDLDRSFMEFNAD